MIKIFMFALLFTLYVTPTTAKGNAMLCLQVKYLILMTGSMAAAEQQAAAFGYTPEQIATAKRVCLKKGTT